MGKRKPKIDELLISQAKKMKLLYEELAKGLKVPYLDYLKETHKKAVAKVKEGDKRHELDIRITRYLIKEYKNSN